MLIRAASRFPKQPVCHFVEIEGGRRKEQEVDGEIPPREPGQQRDEHYTHYYFRPLREHYADFSAFLATRTLERTLTHLHFSLADTHHMQMLDGLFTVDHEANCKGRAFAPHFSLTSAHRSSLRAFICHISPVGGRSPILG